MFLEQSDINHQAEGCGAGSSVCKDTRLNLTASLACEAANENAIPKEYMEQYVRLPIAIKQLCDWETIASRLLSNSGEKLKLAQAMQGEGELVGIDSEGKAMFKDKGPEPVMYGYDSDKQLLKIYNRNPEEMKLVKQWANYPEICASLAKEGYEMFPCDNRGSLGKVGDFGDLSEEMVQIEMSTNRQFVASKDDKEWRASWLKSDKNPNGNAWCIDFNELDRTVGVYATDSIRRHEGLGVVRLLRV